MEIPEMPLEPKEPKLWKCPVCGEYTDTVYEDLYNNVIGCPICLHAKHIWEEEMEDEYD